MPSELLQALTTTDDLRTLRQELDLLETALFMVKDHTFTNVLYTQVRAPIATIIEREIRQSKLSPTAYLHQVTKELDTLPTLRLTIACRPTQEMVNQIVAHACQVLAQQCVIEFVYQPEVIAGAHIVWQGKYADYSLQEQTAAALSAWKKMTGEKHSL